MKKLRSKIPAIIAMTLALFVFGFMIACLIAVFTCPPVEDGIGLSFAFWVYGMSIATLSFVFYIWDAILSFHKASHKIDPVFNIVLGIYLLAATALLIILSGVTPLMVIVWNVIYLSIFVLEFFSIVRQKKAVTETSACT